MEQPIPTPPKDQEQREIFARVWQRVMAGREAACPLPWGPDPEAQAAPEEQAPPEAPRPDQPDRPGPAPEAAASQPEGEAQPALPVPRAPGRPRSDFPQPAGVLGPGCEESVPLLQSLIRRELADGREYQTLARRAGGQPGRVLAALAGEKKRRAKALSAACFLITGARYWPEGTPCPPVTSYLGTLRRRFHREQEAMAAYLAGAEATEDPCLRALFQDHAQGSWDQACRLRALVEMY